MASRSAWLKTGSRPFLRRLSASAETPDDEPVAERGGALDHPEVADVEDVEGAEGDDGARHAGHSGTPPLGAVHPWGRIGRDDHLTTTPTTTSMITPDPAADEGRRRALRRMRTLAVSLLLLAAVVYVVTLGRDGFLGLRERRRRGLDGRRDRGLVRGHRAVPAPAGPAGPAHRADPAAQGRAGPQPRGVRGGELPPGGHHPRAARGGGRSRERIGHAGSPTRRTPAGSSTRSRTSPRSGWARSATSTSPTWSARRWCRASARSRSRRCSGGLLGEMVRDDLHHGLVDLALEELHQWLVENPETVAEILGERAPWWTPPRLNEAVTRPGPHRAGALGARHPRRPAPPRPPGAGLDAGPAGRGPAARPGHPGPHRGAQGAHPRPPAGGRQQHLAVERAAPRAAGLAGRPGGRRARPAAAWRSSTSPRGCCAEEPLRRRLDGIAADLDRVRASAATAARRSR